MKSEGSKINKSNTASGKGCQRAFRKSAAERELSQSLLGFAVGSLRVAASLPRTAAGLHAARQIIESGTSSGVHYAAARASTSKDECAQGKARAVESLLKTLFWLELIEGAQLAAKATVKSLQEDARELVRRLRSRRRLASATEVSVSRNSGTRTQLVPRRR